MSVLVIQDESHPEGGYAVLRFPEVSNEPASVHLLFQPLDEPLRDFVNWPRGRIRAIETRLRDGALEVVVGPDVVNAMPADTAVQITLDELDLRNECRWPSLVLQPQRRRSRLPRVAQPEVTEPVVPRVRRPQYQPADTMSEETVPRIKVSRPEPPQAEPRPESEEAQLPSEPAVSEPADLESPTTEISVPETPVSEAPVSEPARLELLGSELPATEPSTERNLELAGSNRTDERKELERSSTESATPAPLWGRDAPSPPPRRPSIVLPVLIALVVGIAAGALGYRYLLPANVILSGGGTTDGGAADRLLMEALNTADVASGKPFYDRSRDDLWTQAGREYQDRDFAGSALHFRMAMRVALRESYLPTLLNGLDGALKGSDATKPQAERIERLLLSLSALAGNLDAFCRLADSYGSDDAAYAQQLRDRAHALREADPSAQGC